MAVHLHRLLIVLAAAVCLLFAGTLTDIPRVVLSVRPMVAPPVPDSVGERNAQLTVNVRRPDGTPVGEASVTVLLIRDRRAYLAGFSHTSEQGQAAFSDLPRGEVWILSDASGQQRASSHLMLGAEPRSVDLVSRPGHRLELAVLGDDQQPVDKAHVEVRCADPLPFAGESDEKGLVALGRLCPPPYTVEVLAPGYERVVRSGVHPAAGPVRITVRKLGSIRARILVADGSPAPLSTIFVAGVGLWPARQTQSDAFGKSIIAGLPAGAYDLRAIRGDLASRITSGVVVRHGQETRVTLTLEQGRFVSVQVVESSVEDAPAVPGANVVLVEGGLSPFPLEGRTGPNGTVSLGPVPNGPLSASAQAKGYVSAAAVPVGPEETSVRVPLLKAGTIVGDVVDSRGFAVGGAFLEVVGTDSLGFPIAETPTTQAFRQAHFSWALQGPRPLIPAGELGVMPGPIPPIPHGHLSASSGNELSAVPAEPVAPWVTDGAGQFSISPVPPGRVSVIVRHPAYVETISESVMLPPGGTARVHVVLQVGGGIEGRVVDDRSFPVAGVRVQLTAQQGTSDRSTLTADDGTFAFSAVARDVVLSAYRQEVPDQAAFKERFEVAADERKEVEIVLPRQRNPVVVTVNDDRGYPVDAAQVTATSLVADTALRRTAFTSAQGVASIADAATLNLRIVVQARGFGTLVRIVDNAPEEIELRLAPGMRASGRVTARDGRDRVAEAKVTVYLETGARHLVTNEEGVYRLDDLNPGQIRVRVEHEGHVSKEAMITIPEQPNVDRVVEVEAIDLEVAGMVEGEVLDDRGHRVVGARVARDKVPEFLPLGVLPPGVVETDERGEFVLGGLPEGSVELEAYSPGLGRGREKNIAVQAERTTRRVRIVIEEQAEDRGGPAVTAGLLATLEEPAENASGVLVVAVMNGSEAERMGLAPGDLIMRVDGVSVGTVREAQQRLRGPDRQDMLLEIQRGQQSLKLQVPRERMRQ